MFPSSLLKTVIMFTCSSRCQEGCESISLANTVDCWRQFPLTPTSRLGASPVHTTLSPTAKPFSLGVSFLSGMPLDDGLANAKCVGAMHLEDN